MDPLLQKVARALAGGCLETVARAVFAHTALRNLLLGKVVHLVNDECATICRKNSGSEQVSLFRKMPFSALQEFKWAACVTELEDKCPFLYRLFTTIVSHSDHRNTNKCGSNHIPGVCMCIAVLLKERNREMSGIQTYISLALFNRVPKKVCYTKRALTKLILIF